MGCCQSSAADSFPASDTGGRGGGDAAVAALRANVGPAARDSVPVVPVAAVTAANAASTTAPTTAPASASAPSSAPAPAAAGSSSAGSPPTNDSGATSKTTGSLRRISVPIDKPVTRTASIGGRNDITAAAAVAPASNGNGYGSTGVSPKSPPAVGSGTGSVKSKSKRTPSVDSNGGDDEDWDPRLQFAGAALTDIKIKLETLPDSNSAATAASAASPTNIKPSSFVQSAPAATAAATTPTKGGTKPTPGSPAAAAANGSGDDDSAREDSTVRMEDLGLQNDLDLTLDDLAADPNAMNEAFDKTLESAQKAAGANGGGGGGGGVDGQVDVEIEVDSDGDWDEDEPTPASPTTTTAASAAASPAVSPPRTSLTAGANGTPQLRVSKSGKLTLTKAQAASFVANGTLRMRNSASSNAKPATAPPAITPSTASAGGAGGASRLPSMKEEDETGDASTAASDRKRSESRLNRSKSSLGKGSDPHKRISPSEFAALQSQLAAEEKSSKPAASAAPATAPAGGEPAKKRGKRPATRTRAVVHATLRLNKSGTARIEQAQAKAVADKKSNATRSAATAALGTGAMSGAKQTQVLSSAVHLTSFVMQLPSSGIRFVLGGTRPASAPNNITGVTMDLVGEPFWTAMSEGLGWAARMGIKVFRGLFPLTLTPYYLNANEFLTAPPGGAANEFRAVVNIVPTGMLEQHLQKPHILNLLKKLAGTGGGRDGRPDAPLAIVLTCTTKLKNGREVERMLCMLRTTAKTLLSSLTT